MSTTVKLSAQDRCSISNLSKNICSTNNYFESISSKLTRIKAAADYTFVLHYYNNLTSVPGTNITSIVYTGTTPRGVETVTKTITYDDASVPGSNVISSTLS
jgi:hypothetical protein